MVYEALKNAIARVLQVYIKEITADSTFAGDLGADSIDMVQIFKCVEEELEIDLPDTNLDMIITVQDAVDWIEKVNE